MREGGARPLCQASDVLKALDLPDAPAPGPSAPKRELSLSQDARRVLEVLGPVPRTPAQAAADTALPMPRVLAALMELEFAGAAASHPGQLYTCLLYTSHRGFGGILQQTAGRVQGGLAGVVVFVLHV